MPKKNFRKVPRQILLKVKQSKLRYFVAGCLETYSKANIKDGILRHLDIIINNNRLEFPKEKIPEANRGKYCDINVNGQIIKRYDLPKETYSVTIEAPNYGDSYKGTHDVTWSKERYQRDFIAPRLSSIKIECLDTSQVLDVYTFKFEVSEVLDKESEDFESRSLESINLLQENIYKSDLIEAGSTFSDYLHTIKLSWEILPPGTKDEVIGRIFQGTKPTPEQIETATDRYNFFTKLNPIKLVYGSSGFQRYFGALLNEELVVFENVKYGNAIYVMYENWQELSTKSRIDLLSGRFGDNFNRVIHRKGWKGEIRRIIKEHKKDT